jgi:adenylosuccinate synthase
MVKQIILLSGPVASGKTTLGDLLIKHHQFVRLKTRELIASMLDSDQERRALQEAGERLDRETGGEWVVKALAKQIASQSIPEDASILVDAVRIEAQIKAIRRAFGHRVTHIHLKAPLEILSSRYTDRSGVVKELSSYDEVRANPTESRINELERIADIVIDTQRSSKHDVLIRAASHLGLYGRGVERVVDVLIGGQYGSEGKGQIAAYLAREYDYLVRVGGPNAGHKVYFEPQPYTFHQLPSGSLSSQAKLIIGSGAVISVPTLLREIAECKVDSRRLYIDPQAVIIENQDIDFEKGDLVKTIGSTGQGVGSATSRKVLRTAANPKVRLANEESDLKPFLRETREVLDLAFAKSKKVFLEGTQGTGLSLHHGHYPYVTSRDTTVSGCLAEAGIAPSRVRKTIMVCRTYPIRVQSPGGASSGPMEGELTWEEISKRSGIPLEELQETEKTSTTRRQRRVSEFNWELLRKAASLNGPTDIALTFVDYLDNSNKNARRFDQLTPDTIRRVEEIERVAGAPVSLIATRFDYRSIIDRRAW